MMEKRYCQGAHISDSKAIVMNYIDRVWNRHDYIQHSRNVPPGREGLKAFFRMIESSFSDVAYTVEDVIAEGDKVVWRWILRGRHTDHFQNMPTSGRDCALSVISMMRLEDGKLAQLRAV
jgi:steroid delta-isomerase-like uncharacterized protein